MTDMKVYGDKRTELQALVLQIETSIDRSNEVKLTEDPETKSFDYISVNFEEQDRARIDISASIGGDDLDASFASSIHTDSRAKSAIMSMVDSLDSAIVFLKHRFKEYL